MPIYWPQTGHLFSPAILPGQQLGVILRKKKASIVLVWPLSSVLLEENWHHRNSIYLFIRKCSPDLLKLPWGYITLSWLRCCKDNMLLLPKKIPRMVYMNFHRINLSYLQTSPPYFKAFSLSELIAAGRRWHIQPCADTQTAFYLVHLPLLLPACFCHSAWLFL